MTTAYITHPRYTEHEFPGYQHPEHPGRIRAIWQELSNAGVLQRVQVIEPEPIPNELLALVHTTELVELLAWIAKQPRLTLIDSDTYALPASSDVARLSAGGAIKAVESVLSGNADNALAVIRPPGHHATPDRAMGFCLLNNVAIAARYAQQKYTIKRVMIVDIDVHHGNGTQDCFYQDETVLFVSTHQYPFYPGTGAIHEIGRGAGRGYTLNIPLESGYGDESYTLLFEQIIWQAAQRFAPELILVSAGFDAHWNDPLAMMKLSLSGYAHLTRELKRMAEQLCEGKIVFVVAGGYDLQALSHGIRNIVHVLLDEEETSDPYGPPVNHREPDVSGLITQIRRIHDL